jgi:FMN reductase
VHGGRERQERIVANTVQLMGLGGSLRAASTSRTALEVALQATTAAGAHARLVWVRDLDLPLYTADLPVRRPVREFVDAVYACDAMIWSSPTYHGSVSGSFKNALDWLILLAERDPPYLTNKPVGLVTTAGGVQGLQAINSMEFVVRALRGWSVPSCSRWRSLGGRSTATAGSPTMPWRTSCARSARRSAHESPARSARSSARSWSGGG